MANRIKAGEELILSYEEEDEKEVKLWAQEPTGSASRNGGAFEELPKKRVVERWSFMRALH